MVAWWSPKPAVRVRAFPLLQKNVGVAERLGGGLQNLTCWFESNRQL